MDFHGIYAVSKKEYRDYIRNRWFMTLALIFFLLAVVTSYFGTSGMGFKGLEETVAAMMSLNSFLIPIVAIMMGHGVIINEREKGSIHILLSHPLTRLELFLGKYFAMSLLLFTTLFLGFGGAAAVISVGGGEHSSWLHYIHFLFSTFLMGMVFLGFSFLVSTIAERKSTAIGGGIFIWFFFTMIMGLLFLGILSIAGVDYEALLRGDISGMPEWIWKMLFISPLDTYQTNVALIYNIKNFFGYETPSIPSYISIWSTSLVLLIWALAPTFLAIRVFLKKDL